MSAVRFPVYEPHLAGNEKKYVNDCLDTNWISSKGKYIGLFEKKFAQYTQRAFATSVSNGTVALHLAFKTLGIGPGDEVIVPTLAYVAVPNMVLEAGAIPVFVDSLPATYQMDPDDVACKITNRTKAVVAVHTYGYPCDMERISAICRQHKLLLIEDNAEALGSQINGMPVGSWADISVYSFFGNKTLTTGEGGMLTTDSEGLIEKAFHLKNQGVTTRTYWHDLLAYNYRMTNICAAIGLAQLENIESILNRKSEIALQYQSLFANAPIEFHFPPPGITHSFWMCSILTPQASMRDPLRDFLMDNGIETRPFFFPAHTMPAYHGYGHLSFPVAEGLSSRGINLPSYPALSDADVQEIAECVIRFFNK